jgi:hypothetical protein
VSTFFCVLLSCVGEAFRRADPQSKESYRMSKTFISFRSQILNRNRPEGLIRIYLLIFYDHYFESEVKVKSLRLSKYRGHKYVSLA